MLAKYLSDVSVSSRTRLQNTQLVILVMWKISSSPISKYLYRVAARNNDDLLRAQCLGRDIEKSPERSGITISGVLIY